MFRLVDDLLKVDFADLAIAVLFVDAVLVPYFLQLSELRVDDLLLVILLLDEVLVDDNDRLARHLLLLLLVRRGQLVHNLFVPVLELAGVIDDGVEVGDDLLLDVIGHGQVVRVVDGGARVHHYVHEGGHAAAEPRPQVSRLGLRLRQLPWGDLLRRVLIVGQPGLQIVDLVHELADQALGIGKLEVRVFKPSPNGLLQGVLGNEGSGLLRKHASKTHLFLLVKLGGERQHSSLFQTQDA